MARPRNPVEGNKVERRTRTPVAGNRNIMTVRGIPEGHVARWVNDQDNRLLKFKEAGYEFVSGNDEVSVGDRAVESSEGVDSRISKIVGTDRITGNPISAYLMMQKEEWYNEDQEEKLSSVKQVEESMRQQSKSPGRYGNVKIE